MGTYRIENCSSCRGYVLVHPAQMNQIKRVLNGTYEVFRSLPGSTYGIIELEQKLRNAIFMIESLPVQPNLMGGDNG